MDIDFIRLREIKKDIKENPNSWYYHVTPEEILKVIEELEGWRSNHGQGCFNG